MLAGIAVALPLLAIGPVAAQTPPAPTPVSSTLAQRIEQRKNERAITLDKRAQDRLISHCIGGQSNIRPLQGKLGNVLADRLKIYRSIDAKLWVTIGRLKLAEKDTVDLESKRALLSQKITAFNTTSETYKQTIDDILVIDCKADIVGFKSLVDTLRLQHLQLRDQSSDIRKHVIDEVKRSLAAHITDLGPKADSQ